jgi:hypothetical protein
MAYTRAVAILRQAAGALQAELLPQYAASAPGQLTYVQMPRRAIGKTIALAMHVAAVLVSAPGGATVLYIGPTTRQCAHFIHCCLECLHVLSNDAAFQWLGVQNNSPNVVVLHVPALDADSTLVTCPPSKLLPGLQRPTVHTIVFDSAWMYDADECLRALAPVLVRERAVRVRFLASSSSGEDDDEPEIVTALREALSTVVAQ